jgi:transcriptional regulator with XRE-family HTH domain
MDTKKLIGSRIKQLRRTQKYSQEKLAEIAGINSKYLSSIERGAENPTLDLFIKLAQALKVDLRELFEIDNESINPKMVRRRLKALVNEIRDEQLVRILRALESLVH